MKRTLVTSIIAVAATVGIVASSHAQGRVLFENYGYYTFAPITYGLGPGGTVGAGVNNSFTAGLYYFLGTATGAAGSDYPVAGWELAPVSQTINSGATAGPEGVGLFVGPIVNIIDYTAGPISFEVTAYNGADYASSSLRAHSAAFTLSSIATGQSPAGEFGSGLMGFAITPVPEPTVFALAGLGAAALMAFRRKK
jgi:hypothetical protein